MCATCTGEDEESQRPVTDQSEIETLGVVRLASPIRSSEDRQALSITERTTRKSEGEDGYVSGLLLRKEDPSLPNNYYVTMRRLESLEKKLS